MFSTGGDAIDFSGMIRVVATQSPTKGWSVGVQASFAMKGMYMNAFGLDMSVTPGSQCTFA